MLEIVYCKNGVSYSDFYLEKEANEIIKTYRDMKYMTPHRNILVSTGNIIRMFMVKVAKGEFDYQDICVTFNNKTTNMLKNGQLENALGDGFLDVDYKLAKELVRLM